MLWQDQFDGNDAQFTTSYDDDIDFVVKNGVYEVTHKKTDYYHTKTFGVPINAGADFEIETRVRWIKGEENAYFGLVWGYLDLDNHYDFVIRNDKTYRIKKKRYERSVYPVKWTESDAIKNDGEWNVLKIARKGMKIQFSVNGQLLYENSFWPLFGNKVGFKVEDNCKVHFDYITVNQPRKVRVAGRSLSPYKKENLGPPVNTKYSEVSCVISHDGKLLALNRNNHPGNPYPKEKNDDIWFSEKQGDSWSTPENAGKPLNNDGNNFVISISPDQNTLFIMNTYEADGSSAGSGMSLSHRGVSGWQMPKNVDIIGFENNGEYGGGCMSANGKVLLLTLEDDRSYGYNDLYVSFKENDELWSKPQNLGPVINSFDHDYSPFLAADGKTLYFASLSHPGYGDADIFVSKRLDDSWTKWSTPLNLGRSINTTDWDGHFSVEASGEYAYMTSYNNSLGSSDIFRIRLKDEMKPEPVVVVSGRVLDSETGKPIGADISYHELSSDDNQGLARSNPKTGEYKIVLTEGYEYSFYAKNKGYVSVHYNEDYKQIDQYKEITRDIYLTPLKLNQSVVMNNVFFEPNETVLLDKSKPEMDHLVELMKEHRTMKIEVGGHTNPSSAPDAFHEKLSSGRANKIKEYMVSKGISSSRIVAKGYGCKVPIDKGKTVNEKMKNMRVEFKITQF